MADEWYCQVMGSEFGPMSAFDLSRMAQSRQLGPDDLVRRGNGEWHPARLVKGLFSNQPSVASVPPVAATPPAKPADKRMVIGIVAGSLLLFCCVGPCFLSVLAPKPPTNDATTAPDNFTAPQAIENSPTKEIVQPAPPIAVIRNNAREMTDAQWNQFSRELSGKSVRGQGWVTEVNEKVLGGFEIWIDVDPPGTPLSVQDVMFDIPKSQAMSFKKEQQVSFSGRIQSATNMLGKAVLVLEDAIVE